MLDFPTAMLCAWLKDGRELYQVWLRLGDEIIHYDLPLRGGKNVKKSLITLFLLTFLLTACATGRAASSEPELHKWAVRI